MKFGDHTRYYRDNHSVDASGVVLLRCKECKNFKPHSDEHFQAFGEPKKLRLVCRHCAHAIESSRRMNRDYSGDFKMDDRAREHIREIRKNNPESYRKNSRNHQRKRLATVIGSLENKRKQALYRSRRRGGEFNITIDDLLNQLDKQNWQCAITGDTMTAISGQGNVPSNISIDKIDPKKGYVVGNVQLVCHYANVMKQNCTQEQLYSFCQKVLSRAGRIGWSEVA